MATVKRAAPMRGAAAGHMTVIRDGKVIGHRSSLGRPHPWWNLRLWLWLAKRRIEYRKWERE